MRDNFYHWLAVALAFAVFFGASLARAADGQPELYNLVWGGLITALSACGCVRSFRRAKAGEDA